MNKTNKGFLLVLMDCPADLEDEFNAWYDTEHLAERLAVPGFETALRFVCIDGAPRYLAMYDLANPDVLSSPEYLRVAGANSSPWTRRVTSRVRIYRSAGSQIYPGNAVTGRPARLLLLRFASLAATAAEMITAGMRANFEGRSQTRQVRVFAYDTGAGIDYLEMVEASAPLGAALDLGPFGACANALDLVNTYVPYGAAVGC
jgi:hypothetical protein